MNRPYQQMGLTLIEVLIALAIVGIAMTAVIKAASQNIHATAYLQNKSIATWVGQEILNEARVGTLSLPNPPDTLKEKTMMLGQTWYWEAHKESTANKHILKLSVDVFNHEPESDDAPIATLETYTYED